MADGLNWVGIFLGLVIIIAFLVISSVVLHRTIEKTKNKEDPFYSEDPDEDNVPPDLPPLKESNCKNNIYSCSSGEREKYCVDYYNYVSSVRAACQAFCVGPEVDKSVDNCYNEGMCYNLAINYPEFRFKPEVFETCDVCTEFNIASCNKLDVIVPDLVRTSVIGNNVEYISESMYDDDVINILQEYKLNDTIISPGTIDTFIKTIFKIKTYTWLIVPKEIVEGEGDLSGIVSEYTFDFRYFVVNSCKNHSGIIEIVGYREDWTVIPNHSEYMVTIYDYNRNIIHTGNMKVFYTIYSKNLSEYISGKNKPIRGTMVHLIGDDHECLTDSFAEFSMDPITTSTEDIKIDYDKILETIPERVQSLISKFNSTVK